MNTSWTQYYEDTKALEPSSFLIEAFQSFQPEPGVALDLGCGAGRDTRYLLEKGFEVKAVDNDPAAKKYLDLLPHQNKLEFICSDFENLPFAHYDLVNAHYALPFTKKDSFDRVMDDVIDSINPGGLFVGQLFGRNDEWNTLESQMSFCERKEIEILFTNFKIAEIREVDEDGTTANGNLKHWHVFNIIAQK